MNNWYKICQGVMPVRRSLEYSGNSKKPDPVIKKGPDGTYGVHEIDGTITEMGFKSCEEAKSYYPEGEEENE